MASIPTCSPIHLTQLRKSCQRLLAQEKALTCYCSQRRIADPAASDNAGLDILLASKSFIKSIYVQQVPASLSSLYVLQILLLETMIRIALHSQRLLSPATTPMIVIKISHRNSGLAFFLGLMMKSRTRYPTVQFFRDRTTPKSKCFHSWPLAITH